MRAALSILLSLLLAGCAAYQVVEIDAAKEPFPTQGKLKDSELARFRPHSDLSRPAFFVVHTRHSSQPKEYREFILGSLAQLGITETMDAEEFARMIIERDIDGADASLDLVNLHRVYREVGPYLVMVFNMNSSGDWADHRITVIDPEGKEALFDARRRSVIFAGVDNEVNLPLLNALRDWVIASGGLSDGTERSVVAGPRERTEYGWHIDELSRSTHIASGMRVAGRVAGMAPQQHHAYDGDFLNAGVGFENEAGLWMDFFVYPRFHGMVEPTEEIKASAANSARSSGAKILSVSSGEVGVDGTRRPAFAASMLTTHEDHEVFTWTVIVPTRAWYLKGMASEVVRDGIEPGAEALRVLGLLYSTLGVPEDMFDDGPKDDASGFRESATDACRTQLCHPPRSVPWIGNNSEQEVIELAEPQRIVDDGVVTLYPGDAVLLEAELVDGAIAGLTAVEAVRDPARTIAVRFEQADGNPDTRLQVDNPFDAPLKFQLAALPPGYRDSYPLVSCPVAAGEGGDENWPYAMPRVSVTGFRLLEDGAGACEY